MTAQPEVASFPPALLPGSRKERSVFPAQPTPRKEDLLMESGEYWLSAEQRAAKGQQEKSAFRQQLP